MDAAARARARRQPVPDGRAARVRRRRRRCSAATSTLSTHGRVAALYRDGTPVASLVAGERGVVVLDQTPFYAESGGQVGDRGELSMGGVCLTLFAVEDTQKIQPDVFGHHGEVKTGELKVGDTVAAEVDHAARARTMRNHSATHLMHKALREVLGRARPAEGLAGRRRQDALRLRARRADDRRRDPPRRGDRQRRDPRQRGDAGAGDADRRGAEDRRDDALRREVRRRGARARHRQLARALRRHARGAHRRHRLLQDRRRRRRRRRHPPRSRRSPASARSPGCRRRKRTIAAAAAALKAPAAEIEAKIAQMLEHAKALEKEVARLQRAARLRPARDVLAARHPHRQGRQDASRWCSTAPTRRCCASRWTS